MKFLLIAFLFFNPTFWSLTQDNFAATDTVESAVADVRLIANVKDLNQEYMLIVVEKVISLGPAVRVMPSTGDEIYVRLSGHDLPLVDSRIDVDLQERIEVGEMPCAYILTHYRPVD